MCHEDDAIMHKVAIMQEPQAGALCNQVHYCIIRVCHIKRSKLSWECHNCFIAGHGTLPFYRCGLISKSAITTYRTLKCTVLEVSGWSDVM